jgi:hypothetical protein
MGLQNITNATTIAATNMSTSFVDTPSTGSLTLGSTNATSIACGKTPTIAGGLTVLRSCNFVSNATLTFSNTAAITSIVPTGVGSMTYPLNTLFNYSLIEAEFMVVNTFNGGGTLTFFVYINGVSQGSVAWPIGGVIPGMIRVRIQPRGMLYGELMISGQPLNIWGPFTGWSASVTSNIVLDVRAQFSTAAVTNSLVCECAYACINYTP